MARKPDPGKRPYRSRVRASAAEATRRAILDAAHRLLAQHGYGAMTMERVAADAGVALDTVYAAVGRKPTLLRLLIETAISGTDDGVPAEERAYVKRIRAAPRAADKLAIYADALREIHPRLAPLVRALRDASARHAELAALWREIANRRRRNMGRFAAELIATGELRAELDPEELADVLWTTAAPEVYLLFVEERGWSAERYAAWIARSWRRLFL